MRTAKRRETANYLHTADNIISASSIYAHYGIRLSEIFQVDRSAGDFHWMPSQDCLTFIVEVEPPNGVLLQCVYHACLRRPGAATVLLTMVAKADSRI